MNIIKLFKVALFVFFSITLIAQNRQEVQEIFKNKGEVYFKFAIESGKEIQYLSGIISLDNIKENIVYAYANKKEFVKFLELGIDYTILPSPGELITPKMLDDINKKEIMDWDYYLTYQAYLDMIYQFQTDYPDICEVFSIGQSVEGRELLFARISDNVGQDEGEAQFMYTATMHGDETAGYDLSLRLIDYLLSNYGTDPKVNNLVENLDIWINPLANPDGTYAGGNNTVYGATRYNANWVDLNRNYPDPEDGPHPDGEEWQAETLAFMALAENNHFVLSSNWHGGAEVFNYPWDTWAQLAADDDWWYYVGREWADTVHIYSPSGYFTDLDNGVTNGYAWYTIAGGRQDYMNYFHQCREFTLELSNIKLLPANQLPAYWDYNYRSFLNYMEQTLFGITGTVTDANTGDPLVAEIFIENHDIDSSWVYSYESTGNYYRPIFEGTWDVTFTAPGYYPQTFENVEVQNRQVTQLDVQLVPGNLIPDFIASATAVPAGASVDFTDMTFGNPISWEWTFEGGTPSSSTEQNPAGIVYSTTGSYDVSLTVSDGTNTQTITKPDYIIVSVEYFMQNTTVTTCEGIFYDSGGPTANYNDNEDFTMTFLPGETDNKIECQFTSFNVEWHSSCDYDWLKIFDGSNTSSPLIGKYCGTTSPGTVTATNEDGALTFQFHSDNSVNESGWSGNISCIPSALAPVADFTADATTIFEGESVQFSDLSTNNPTSREWFFEGGTPGTSNEQNPLITYNTPGAYDVTLTVTNAYGSDTKTIDDYITVDELTGINTVDATEIKIYPNPAKDILYISLTENLQLVSILNIMGEVVYTHRVSSDIVRVNISDLKEGIYIVRIIAGENLINKKIQVKK